MLDAEYDDEWSILKDMLERWLESANLNRDQMEGMIAIQEFIDDQLE